MEGTEPRDPAADTYSLVAFLATRDAACPACNYGLRGLTSDRCPECHGRLVLSVALAEPPIVGFVLAVIGLAACGATAGFLLAAVLVMSLVEKGLPHGDQAMVLLWAPAVVATADAIAMGWLLRPAQRQWFARRSAPSRWGVALLCWAISVAVFAAWLVLLFSFM